MNPTSPEQQAQMKDLREKELLARWLKGSHLNLPQLQEIRHLIGEEKFVQAARALGIEPESAADVSTPSARWPYVHRLSHYQQVYRRTPRQLKRWIAIGRAKGEMPPLDEPPRMKDWWVKNQVQRVPDDLLKMAVEARTSPESPAQGAPSIDVSQLTLAAGEAVTQARQFLAATAQSLSAAYKGDEQGRVNDAEVDRCHRRWEKAAVALQKAEANERAAQKQSGDLIPRIELMADLSQLLEIQRTMRLSMSRRIRKRLPWLSDEQSAQLHEAIELERTREESILRRLKEFQSPAEIELELEAA